MGENTVTTNNNACLRTGEKPANGIDLIHSLSADYERALTDLGIALGICPDGCVVVDCSRSSINLMNNENALLFLYKLCRAADREGISLCAHSNGFPADPDLQESMMFWLGSQGFVALSADADGLEMVRTPGKVSSIGFERDSPFFVVFDRIESVLHYAVSDGAHIHFTTSDGWQAHEAISSLTDTYWGSDPALGWQAYVTTVQNGRRYLSTMSTRLAELQ